jgi:hypothetical protein
MVSTAPGVGRAERRRCETRNGRCGRERTGQGAESPARFCDAITVREARCRTDRAGIRPGRPTHHRPLNRAPVGELHSRHQGIRQGIGDRLLLRIARGFFDDCRRRQRGCRGERDRRQAGRNRPGDVRRIESRSERPQRARDPVGVSRARRRADGTAAGDHAPRNLCTPERFAVTAHHANGERLGERRAEDAGLLTTGKELCRSRDNGFGAAAGKADQHR